jgi:hypothetical protein
MATLKVMKGKVLVTDLERGSRMVKGIIIPTDDGKSEGIRPRWAKVYGVGDDVEEIKVGQWILIEANRWTRMMQFKEDEHGPAIPLWSVEYPKAVMLVSDEMPSTDIFSEFTTSRPF